MWQRFTERARRVIFYAQEEAVLLGLSQVSTEHLLLALLRDPDCTAVRILQHLKISPEAIRKAIRQCAPRGTESSPRDMSLTPRGKRVLDLAYEEARQLSNNFIGFIGTEHLLLGLIREEEGLAGQILIKQFGINLEKLRELVKRLYEESPRPERSPFRPPTADCTLLNPFPGMNPYLEQAHLWAEFHQAFISTLCATINRMLPTGYSATVEERVYSERAEAPRFLPPERVVIDPSVRVFGDVAEPPYRLRLEPYEVREPFIQILRWQDAENREVVTVIELLSPNHKLPNTNGHTFYRNHQADLLKSTVNLIEIDLLHWGEHTVAVPIGMLTPHVRWDYVVSLHRGGSGGRTFEYWLAKLPERLPSIFIPLAQGDPYVGVNLQALVDTVYQEGQFHTKIDYSQEPAVPPSIEAQQWVAEYLRGHGVQ